ncbi:hypothetical protein [Mucilaginibacter sp. MD40]|uniref:hypothetical protein n=1 Tax=Mucilaginibacter sp. MD40 TaxID=2029590 RepID=UPI00117BE8EA|nr:hypothetical protein [Mucilaginibacter sp. MD40]
MKYNYLLCHALLCMVFASLFPKASHAQSASEGLEYNKVSIASPTAGAITKFVDIPVSLHTGIPQISIPLYTVKDGSLSVPISMSYHASGLKVGEPASWVGAGWSLNAGGVITRSVRGTPDEKGTVNNFQKTGYYSNYGYRSYAFLKNQPDGPDTRPDSFFVSQYERFSSGEYDSEPDMFFFNVGGYSGKFYFNDDRTPMLLPEQDIKIEVNYTYGSSESIQGFTLTTPDGTRYYFGATPSTTDTDPVEYSKVMTAQNGVGWDKVLSSWYLNKIVSFDGNNTITLNYRPVAYSYHMISTNYTVSSGNQAGFKLIRNIIHGVELSSITSSNAQVNFVQAAQPRQDLTGIVTQTMELESANTGANAAYPLGRIDIMKPGAVLLKSYKFDYSYFDDPNGVTATNLGGPTSDKKRLKLLSILEQGASGTLNPPYKFDYFDEPVPRRLSLGQDHWGFSNGVTTNGDKFIGTFYNTYNTSSPTTVAGADRDPHWPAMRGGTLKKITFPTGGYNLYDFEPNDTYNSQITASNGERTFYASKSAGYDGCDCTKTATLDTTFGTYNYVIQLVNKHEGGIAELDVFDSNWAPLDHLSALNDETKEIIRNYAPGLYHIRVTKYKSYGGNGADAIVYKMAGTIVNTNAMVGGLRIKTITQSSANGNPDMVTFYDYTDSSSGQQLSTGVVFGKPTIAQPVRNQIYAESFRPLTNNVNNDPIYPNGCPVVPGSGLSYLTTPASIRPMGSTQGSHIGYRKVTTRQQGNGYTVSMFNMDGDYLIDRKDIVNRTIITSPNTCTMDIPNFPSAPEPNFFKRGQLEYEAKYSEAGVLLQDMSYTNQYQENLLTAPAMVNTTVTGINNGTGMFTWYDQKTGRKVTEVVHRRSYNSSGVNDVMEQSFYDNAYHHQLTRKVTVNSIGETLETRYRYVPDYTITAVDGLDTKIPALATDQDALTTNYKANWLQCGTDHRCRRNLWLDYDLALSHKRMTFIDYRIANFTGPNATYRVNLQNALTNASTVLKPLIDMRIQNNFALVETVNLKNGNVMSAVYNTYDYKLASQNKIYLSKVSKTDYLVPPSSFTYTQTGTDNTSLVKDAAYNEKAAFEYNAGNISQVKLTDNVPSAYRWGYSNQYPVLAAKNAAASDIFFEGFEEGAGNGTLNDCKTGHYSYTGTYTKALSGLSNGAYVLSYYQKISGAWTWMTQSATVSTGSYTINLNAQVDDVRFAPAGAMLTSYTYDPEIGMTSTMDVNGLASYYDYDEFQRLNTIRDNNKNLLKKYYYNYSNGTANDAPPLPYALIEQISFTSGGGNQNYAEYRISLYTDNTYSTPFTATTDVTVNYKITTITKVNTSVTTSVALTSAVVAKGSSYIYLGSFESGCGNAAVAVVAARSSTSTDQETAKSSTATTQQVQPPGGDTTCVEKQFLLRTGTGYQGGN